MKTKCILAALTTALLAGCGPSHMLKVEPCPDLRTIKPPAGKAQLVVGRSTSFGKGVDFDHYVDSKYIGTTKGYSFFATSVEPGDHYVAGHAENTNLLLLRFEADKTYYVSDVVHMGLFKARVKLQPSSADSMHKDMEGECSYYVRDSSKVEDYEAKDWAEEVKDYGSTVPANAGGPVP
jgi:hypothetical protein